MKKQLILALAATAVFLTLPACTTVETPAPTHTSSSTTTETTAVHRPVSSSVESTTVRSY